MRVLIQRVTNASVSIDGVTVGAIGCGLLVFVGVEDADIEEDLSWMCSKICGLRIFSDKTGRMNYSVRDVDGEILVVSQFTLHACTKKGNRPSFTAAGRPEFAKAMYDDMIAKLKSLGVKKVESGRFGADMNVELLNDGPVTIWIDSKHKE